MVDRNYEVGAAGLAEAALAVASGAMLGLVSKGILSKAEAAGLLRHIMPSLSQPGAAVVIEQIAESIGGGKPPPTFTVIDGGKK